MKLPKLALVTWSWGSGMSGGDQEFGIKKLKNEQILDLMEIIEDRQMKGYNYQRI